MNQIIRDWWPHLVFAFDVTISLMASAHAVLHKRDVRAAIAWSGMIWFAPILGTLLYICFGVNRIERRAQNLRSRQPRAQTSRGLAEFSPERLLHVLGPSNAHLQSLAQLATEVSQFPLLTGNDIAPLVNGCEAYPAMLAAIHEAQRSITFTTYIFDNDATGQLFQQALADAVARGVEVRVIVDDVGRRYSWNSILRPLRTGGVQVAQFLRTVYPWHFRYANLRSHRKILVVDGRLGFTGGMNIRHGNTLEKECRRPIQDLHFRVTGPVVEQMQETFAHDWAFCTGEVLAGGLWFPELESAGNMLARGIADGPDEDFDKLRIVLLGAINSAERSISIVTPYFIPDDAILTALNIAALRGLRVNVVIPSISNLRLVQWAMIPTVRQLLDAGVRVWQSPPPFDHSKLMVIDDAWTMLGSANWDARSLRLNFEFNLEVYDRQFAADAEKIVAGKIRESTPLLAETIDERNLLIRLRDGVARLATPYL
jgi:cardiolipin synthase